MNIKYYKKGVNGREIKKKNVCIKKREIRRKRKKK
jgi:hypothetical protein